MMVCLADIFKVFLDQSAFLHVRACVRLRMCLCIHVLSVWARMRVRLWVRASVRDGVPACIYACLICPIGLSNKHYC